MAELESLRQFFTSVGRPIPLATTGQGDIDLYSPTGILAAQIKTAVSEHEIAMMRARQLRAARQKAEQGRPQWKYAFGYRQGPDGIELDPVTAPMVERVYAHVLAGGSISDGARMLNEAGALAQRWVHPRDEDGNIVSGDMEVIRSKWTAPTLSLFLRKPRNAGLRSHNNVIVGKGTWPPLVDETTWYAAQEALNAPGRAPGRKSVQKHLLTSVLRCGKCGEGLLHGKWIKPTSQDSHVITYTCRKCRGCAIRADDVEPLLCEILGERLSRSDAVDLRANNALDSAEAERIRFEKLAIFRSNVKAQREYDDDIIDGARLAGRLARNAEKLAELVAREEDPHRQQVLHGIRLGTPEAADDVLELYHHHPDRFRAVLDLLVAVTVMPVGRGAHNRTFNPDRVRRGLEWKV